MAEKSRTVDAERPEVRLAAMKLGRDGWEERLPGAGRAGPRHAAPEPGRNGREEPGRPARGGGAVRGRYGARPGRPGRDLGWQRRGRGVRAATEPGRGGREERRRDRHARHRLVGPAMEPCRGGREELPDHCVGGPGRRTGRYGARPGRPGRGRSANRTRTRRRWPQRSPAGAVGKRSCDATAK